MSKNLIITIGVVVAVVIGGYFYMQKNSTVTNTDNGLVSDLSSMQVSSVREAPEILQTLDKLSSLKIDDSIFNSVVFRSLQASDVPKPTWTAGRSNPFAPISVSINRIPEEKVISTSTVKRTSTVPVKMSDSPVKATTQTPTKPTTSNNSSTGPAGDAPLFY